jgi:hypothetical protein
VGTSPVFILRALTRSLSRYLHGADWLCLSHDGLTSGTTQTVNGWGPSRFALETSRLYQSIERGATHMLTSKARSIPLEIYSSFFYYGIPVCNPKNARNIVIVWYPLCHRS